MLNNVRRAVKFSYWTEIIYFTFLTIVIITIMQGHGFRNDLVQMMADLEPRFIRFPGNY